VRGAYSYTKKRGSRGSPFTTTTDYLELVFQVQIILAAADIQLLLFFLL
jgi:hypothetical protein